MKKINTIIVIQTVKTIFTIFISVILAIGFFVLAKKADKLIHEFEILNENARSYNEWIQRVTNPQIGIR